MACTMQTPLQTTPLRKPLGGSSCALCTLRARNSGRSSVLRDSLDRNTAETIADAQQPGPDDKATQRLRDRRYFEGLLRSDISQNYGASSTDMLSRSLQLAGGAAAVLVLLTYGFLASNGVVLVPSNLSH